MAGCGDKDESSTPSKPELTPPENSTAEKLPEGDAVSALPDSIPKSFLLTTKTNIWKTELKLQSDGSFTGKYLENVGETNAKYGYPNGKFLICEFEGKFGDLKKVDEHTYAMKLTELKEEYPSEAQWIEGGICYESAPPTGIEGGEWFYVYLPGKPTEGLDKAFTMWYMKSDTIPSTLDVCGFYNPSARYAFFAE